jgi:hypothetical protein
MTRSLWKASIVVGSVEGFLLSFIQVKTDSNWSIRAPGGDASVSLRCRPSELNIHIQILKLLIINILEQ